MSRDLQDMISHNNTNRPFNKRSYQAPVFTEDYHPMMRSSVNNMAYQGASPLEMNANNNSVFKVKSNFKMDKQVFNQFNNDITSRTNVHNSISQIKQPHKIAQFGLSDLNSSQVQVPQSIFLQQQAQQLNAQKQ